MRNDVLNQIKLMGELVPGLNKSELARRFNCDRRTIDSYIKNPNARNRKPRKLESKLDEFKEIIIDKVDNFGASSMAVFKFIEKKGYAGGYHTVNNFVKTHKNEQITKATIRFDTMPGIQAQVDWKESFKILNKDNEELEVNIFLMVLGYSRFKFLKLTTDRVQSTLFECLYEGFKYFKGVPSEILFDNMSTVVDRSKTTLKNISINKEFKHFAMDSGFEVITCKPYRPKTKGKVESLAKLVDRLKTYNEEFNDFNQLELIVKEFNDDINNEISQATNEKPISRFQKEKEHLNPLPNMDNLMSYFHHEKEFKVSNESMIKYKGKKYSVPTRYIGKKVNVFCSDDKLQIYYTKDLIACHTVSDKILHYKSSHAREILKSEALKTYSDDEIDIFIHENLFKMDIFLEE